MKKIFRNAMLIAAACTLTMGISSCSSNSDDNNSGSQTTSKEVQLASINKQYVEKTVIATYTALADDCEQLNTLVQDISSQTTLNKVCDQWKEARKQWEFSEAFLFGAASIYSIDPHIDTWPFDVTTFNNVMSKYHPATDEDDADVIDHMVATTQNFTGFHAMEYIIFRDGNPRSISELTDDELYFVCSVAADLYLSACRLEAAWAGIDHVKASRKTLLEDAEMEPEDNFGEEFINAGKAGSRWKTVTLASVQILDGCSDILGEVADAKIGSAYNGSDINYIESPYSYNSIQDFYDNTMSCKHALYGGLTVDGTTPDSNSLMAYCLTNYPAEAKAAMDALENALAKIKAMKQPFVKNYTDSSAGAAIDALNAFNGTLSTLKTKLQQ